MFLRFVTTRVDEDSRRPEGLFTAAYELRDSQTLDPDERKRMDEILIWFNQHLPAPPKKFSAGRAIFWFKSTGGKAQECIEQMWDLVHLIREHDYHVEVLKCRTLGNICYEDDFQVAAYPSPQDSRVAVS